MQILTKILDNLNSIALVLNRERQVVYVSPSVKKILGYEQEELMHEEWWTKTCENPMEITGLKNNLEDLIKDSNHNKRTYERRVRTKSNRFQWILWNISLIDETGEIIAIGNDITKRKEFEELLEEKKKLLELQQSETISGLKYAGHLQQSILPDMDFLKQRFRDIFVLYLPKDIVSGDFYWYYQEAQYRFIAVADCTGHGVSGSILSVLGYIYLQEIIAKDKMLEPNEILLELNERVVQTLNQNTTQRRVYDGMDIALCRIDTQNNELTFSGANRPLWIVGNNSIEIVNPVRNSIGGQLQGDDLHFKQHVVENKPENTYYLFSDGYVDQFGGDFEPDGKKLNRNRFKDLLLSVDDMVFEEREAYLEYSINNWKQSLEQTDDILVLGFKI